MEFLENKSIFVIGAIGFLGKVMVEKILRTHSNVKKLYLLVRSVDEITATKRFYDEVVEKEIFRVLKEKWGGDLKTLISEKIYLVPGDISCPNMGLKDSNLLEEMKNEVEIIVNLAATTKFHERYDIAFGTNTLGVKHVLNFAKQCSHLEILVHVSTAFVSNQREGIVFETPCKLDDSPSKLDIETERKVIEETLTELRTNTSTEETATTQAMKDLGLKRAKMYGCSNTYAFTKAMGEMVLNDQNGNLPLIIIRPTVVTSTYKEPFPGWIEGLRTIDGFIVGFGKGKLTSFPCDVNSILDLIPADMVVNAIMMAIVAHKIKPCAQTTIYHVGSSMRNSLRLSDLHHYILQYFTEKPWINIEDGNPIKVKKVNFFNNMATFHTYMTIHYPFLKNTHFYEGNEQTVVDRKELYMDTFNGVLFSIPLSLVGWSLLWVLEFVNKACCNSFQDMYNHLQRRFNWVMQQLELYGSFLFYTAKFDDTNLESLRIIAARDSDTNLNPLGLDPKDINWEDYFMNIHVPGLIKHVIK